MQGSPAREEGEVPESELDPDTRRRLLILQHGQDTRSYATSASPSSNSATSWELVSHGQPCNMNRGSAGSTVESDFMLYEKKQPPHPSLFHSGESPLSSDRFSYQNQRFPTQARNLSTFFEFVFALSVDTW
jgi:RNA polymerase II C-terminal domain phosphatase-like 1/2